MAVPEQSLTAGAVRQDYPDGSRGGALRPQHGSAMVPWLRQIASGEAGAIQY